MGPFNIKKQITENTFEIDIPEAIRKKMRSVFHSSELILFETRDVDQIGALLPSDRADNPNLLEEEAAGLEQALSVPGDSPTKLQPEAVIDQDFGPPADQAFEQNFAPGVQCNWDLNTAQFEDPSIIYYF